MAKAMLRATLGPEAGMARTVPPPSKQRHSPAKWRPTVPDPLFLHKSPDNPILAPIRANGWEAWQVFNSAVLMDQGRIHLLYRALGDEGISRLGYAVSEDGVSIDARLPYPVYQHPTLAPLRTGMGTGTGYSGGGWGGCEDPRLTQIGDTIYMLYVALEGIPQLAITSIDRADFLNQNWNWTAPKNISPPDVIVKSGVLFPEKIKGKYVILYRIFPDIWIDYLDDLDFNDRGLSGKPRIHIRKSQWDSRKIGAGATPIKTSHGWLLIYYAVDEHDLSRYKIGAMLLDLDNPAKVLYRTPGPILGPAEWYENNGHKFGVAYPCGAVVKDGELLVYYGGADSYVCVARADFAAFMDAIVRNVAPRWLHKLLVGSRDAPNATPPPHEVGHALMKLRKGSTALVPWVH